MAELLPAPALTASSPSSSPSSSLIRLPNEILLAIAGVLDLHSLAQWTASSRFFYQLLGNPLYQRDIAAGREGDRSLLWGCRTGNLDTLRRGVAAGMDLAQCGSRAMATALGGELPLAVLSFLLEHGAPANVPDPRLLDHGTGACPVSFWPILGCILDAANQPPRWCPIPVVACFLAHGATLQTTAGGSAGRDIAMAEWDKVLSLVQVRGPRKWVGSRRRSTTSNAGRGAGGDGDLDGDLRYDHCQHTAEPCNVVLARLLLQPGSGADPDLCREADGESLVLRAMRDPRRPLELLRSLADAGADFTGKALAATATPARRVRETLHPRSPLQTALGNAIHLRSLETCPRGRNWDCYPLGVGHPKADEIVRFLLSRGAGPVGSDERTERLLDRWDRQWRKFQRRGGGKTSRRRREKRAEKRHG